jgi:hypothetical protein
VAIVFALQHFHLYVGIPNRALFNVLCVMRSKHKLKQADSTDLFFFRMHILYVPEVCLVNDSQPRFLGRTCCVRPADDEGILVVGNHFVRKLCT